MKKVLLTALAVFSLTFVNAQEENSEFGFTKGNMFLEGNLSFGNTKTTESFQGTDLSELKESNFNFTPKFGYFISNKLALGAQLSVGSQNEEEKDLINNTTDELKFNTFGAGVFARYYFLDLGKRFKTFTEVGLAFESGKAEVNGTETESANGFGIGVDLGINYFVTKNMAISFGLNNVLSYGTATLETPAGDETQVSGLSGNLNSFSNFFDTPSFGLLYKF